MKAVFLDLQTFIPSISLAALEQQVDELVCYPTTQAEQVIERCQQYEVVITNKVVFNEQILKNLPNLSLICITATGTNNVDLNTAEKLGITVMNVAGYSTNSVAQYVFAQLLEFYSQSSKNNQNAQENWPGSKTFCLHGERFEELANKKITLVGYGNIGQKVAAIANAFSMQVLLAERPNTDNIRKHRISFDDAISQADIISIHCPLTPETSELFDLAVFKKMQDHALLINTARGGVINEQDLLNALKNKIIGAAILDVLSQEPPNKSHPFFQEKLSNLKITGHIAWASQEAQQRLLNLVAKNIEHFKHQKCQ